MRRLPEARPPGGERPSRGRGFFVVLLPTMECNLRCGYCFQEHSAGRWDQEQTERVLTEIFELARADGFTSVRLHWQGGEALLMGADYLGRAFSRARALGEESGIEVAQTLQSNLTLYTSEIGELSREFLDGRLGTSFEPDEVRRFEGEDGASRFREAWIRAYRRAADDGVEVGVLSVVSRGALAEGASAYLERLVGDFGIRRVRLLLPFRGAAPGEGGYWLEPRPAGIFLADAYRWWAANGRDEHCYLHPLSFLEAAVRGSAPSHESALCFFAECCADVALAITASGDVILCDSLVGAADPGTFGNVFSRGGLREAYQSPARLRARLACHALISERCAACRYLPHCHGGCLVRAPVQDGVRRYHYCESQELLLAAIEREVRA